MALSIQDVLADKGVHPEPEHLRKLEAKWAQVQSMKDGLEGLNLDDADIALHNTPGGDHVE